MDINARNLIRWCIIGLGLSLLANVWQLTGDVQPIQIVSLVVIVTAGALI